MKRQRRTATRTSRMTSSATSTSLSLSSRFLCRALFVFFLTCSTAWVPSLALLSGTRSRMKQRKGWFPSPLPPQDTTRLHMVLTTPESIIEQASTQNLLDMLIDESVRTSARGPIMMQFDPSSGWIWKRWRGTIFSETWDSCVKSMLYAVIVLMVFKRFPALKGHFSGFNVLWGQLLSVTTFTLTFFVNQSYALWRKCYELSRRLQGRLHDVGLTLAVHATRKAPSSPNEPSTYTAASRQTLELVSRYVRLFNVLTYASFTRSHRPILTPRGMRRLVERGLMTAREREVLVDAEVPATQRHNAVLLWITRVFVEAWQAGHFIGNTGFENQILEKIHVCRAQYGAIGDELAGRMPLAYAHIVQVLVDAILFFYPFMAIASQMSDGLVVLGTGLLTISYQGLFDLAKQFLDPYDNESYGKGEDPLMVDTLIAETNSGSVRWMNSLNEFPVSPQRIKDGDLGDYLLPVRGYSVDELAEMEEERKQREREQQERREREETERRIKEEKTARLKEASEAMIPALFSKTPALEAPSTIALETINGSAKTIPLPSVTAKPFSLSSSDAVASVVSNMNAMAGGIPSSLLPRGTAASKEEDQLEIQQRKRREKKKQDEAPPPLPAIDDDKEGGEGDEHIREMEDFQDDGAFQDLEDWESDQKYLHKFQSFDKFGDQPRFDEVGPDGQEIRLSQLLADEDLEEEKAFASEKEERVQTFEEYSKRAEEIRDTSNGELAETQEILSAVPNAQSSSINPRENKENTYDQTKLDAISQLWGSPPGELSKLPSYSEPEVTGETEMLGEPEAPPSRRDDGIDSFDDDADEEEAPSFGAIGALWGGFDDDDDDDDLVVSGSATRPVREVTRSVREDPEMQSGTFLVSEGSDLRLSQILADEVWVEDDEEEPVEEAVSFEEYAQQIADIIELEKEEQLETEAILNAPAFAEFVGTAEDDETEKNVKATNATLEDDLSIFEMDVVDKMESTEEILWSGGDTAISIEPGSFGEVGVNAGEKEEDDIEEAMVNDNPNGENVMELDDSVDDDDTPTNGESSSKEDIIPDDTELDGKT